MSIDMYLSALATCLPEARDDAAVAVQQARYEAKYAESTDYASVAVCSASGTPVDLAVQAAEIALKLGEVPAERIAFLSYSYIHNQRYPELWAPAAYLQHRLGARHARAVSLKHGCNAQLLACEIALDLVSAGRAEVALVSGADIFAANGFDRWRSDFVAYGDAGSAWLLSARPSGARVLSAISHSECSVEGLHRFEAPCRDLSAQADDYRETKRAFLDRHGADMLIEATQRALNSLWQQTAARTGWTKQDVSHIVFPNLGRKVLDTSYFPLFSEAFARSTWDFGRTVGHLGTSDCAAGLTHLVVSGQASVGDRILLIGAGAGFSFSMLALDLQELPRAAFVHSSRRLCDGQYCVLRCR